MSSAKKKKKAFAWYTQHTLTFRGKNEKMSIFGFFSGIAN